jgi:serine protease
MRMLSFGPSQRARGAILPLLVLSGLMAAQVAPARAAAPEQPFVPGHVLVHYRGEPGEKRVEVPAGESVRAALDDLRDDADVTYANPDYVVRASAFWPNDPGSFRRGQWARDQWNFLSPTRVRGGIGMPGAWQRLIGDRQPGAKGVTVAVLDTGVAYRRKGHRFRRDPDLPPRQRFVHPRDFVKDDRKPLDRDGHGTHVTSTIAQSTDNGFGLTGIAYKVKIMPLRVLNREERGKGSDVARAIRFATEHGADVINLSLEFKRSVKQCDQVVSVCKSLQHALRQGVTVVAAAGNGDRGRIAYPAAFEGVIATGATTYRGCVADYSNHGEGLDIVAPGGGRDKEPDVAGDPRCSPSLKGYEIRQYSMVPAAADNGNFKKFDIVGMEGTSMATAHVSGTAAMVIAAGVCGRRPTPATVATRLEDTAVDRGTQGRDNQYGHGLLNAARATNPRNRCVR